MHFKQQSYISVFEWSMRKPLHFADQDRGITALLTRTTEEERVAGLGDQQSAASFTTTTQRDVPDEIESICRDYHRADHNVLILGSNKPELRRYHEVLKPHMDAIFEDLQSYADRLVGTLRWRNGGTRGHSDLRHIYQYWSFDGTDWQRMPELEGHIALSISFAPQVSEAVRSSIETIAALPSSRETDPIAHELFREAWEQKDRNPRSALIIGIAAAEVGVKNCISVLVPDAEWFAFEMPSPPLHKLMASGIPLLPAKCKIDNRVLVPQKSIRKPVNDGITLRNHVAHAGAEAPNLDELNAILKGVRDLLYLLDYYCGHEWALDMLREETKIELGIQQQAGVS